ncbi:SMI1/KNR4 family protein [Massilia antarctica]|uniref:SMI1/KNR4 family protein n=1 Tax=Massilia antarctica TaxID=2765360 RepID=A0AA49A8V8_9BURK|nr:SMI1/KNR4 family protein [Massilia antarctica]QPI50943.1 SMI1/KNR4 family protein [Massilia antarctica]
MKMLSELVSLLSAYVDDTIPVAESEIRQFAEDQNIALREDHLQFLMRFGCAPDERPNIFTWYEGDFDFDLLKSVYLDDDPDMALPPGTTFFGSNFVGDSLCIDITSGKIHAYDQGERFGPVHETIDGFLLRCLVSVYDEKAFSGKTVMRDLEPAEINAFRLNNARQKIMAATCYQLAYQATGTPLILAEYYFIEQQLIALYPPSNSLVTLNGGVLDKLKA